MPMQLADEINEIDDPDVFVHNFVDDTNSLSNITSIEHPASRRRKIQIKSFYFSITETVQIKNKELRSYFHTQNIGSPTTV